MGFARPVVVAKPTAKVHAVIAKALAKDPAKAQGSRFRNWDVIPLPLRRLAIPGDRNARWRTPHAERSQAGTDAGRVLVLHQPGRTVYS
jgi:hypothetical protein